MRRQVLQADLPSIALWHFHPSRQVLRDGISERDLPSLRHVCKEQRRKDLCDRTDFEDRVAVHSPVVARVDFPYEIVVRPVESMIPTTIPTLWRSLSMRSTRRSRICAPVGKADLEDDCATSGSTPTTNPLMR